MAKNKKNDNDDDAAAEVRLKGRQFEVKTIHRWQRENIKFLIKDFKKDKDYNLAYIWF